MTTRRMIGITLALCVTAVACEAPEETDDDVVATERTETVEDRDEPVRVQLHDRDGAHVGSATLSETGDGVEIALQVHDLEPGVRAFHIHETARCETPDFESADGHFSPDDQEHGFENPEGPHAGDLPNIRIAEDGTADTTFVNPRVTLRNGARALLEQGVALVIHEGEDDYVTDPAGDAGDRIVCGELPAQRS